MPLLVVSEFNCFAVNSAALLLWIDSHGGLFTLNLDDEPGNKSPELKLPFTIPATSIFTVGTWFVTFLIRERRTPEHKSPALIEGKRESGLGRRMVDSLDSLHEISI
jgi:hypothetical protein